MYILVNKHFGKERYCDRKKETRMYILGIVINTQKHPHFEKKKIIVIEEMQESFLFSVSLCAWAECSY